jgi:hypothetical protein
MKNQEIITELKEADATLNGDKYKTWCQVRLAISSAINKLETPDIIELEDERMRWAWKTFPDATAISSLRKLESEIKEIEADINAGAKNPYEYADALMCLFDSAGRQGITPKRSEYGQRIPTIPIHT